MKIGARNRIVGRVSKIDKGAIMCLVKVDIPASQVASVMTIESLEELDIKPGDQVEVIAKAVNILLMHP